jgi:uncharacterized membrane protein
MDAIKILKISATILIIDIMWIYFIMGPIFTPMIETIQSSPMTIRTSGAIAAYLAMIALFYFFVDKNTSDAKALLLGLLAFAVYEGTSYALFTKWNLKIAVLDILWGGILFWLTKKIIY